MSEKKPLSYADSGVNREVGDSVSSFIGRLAKKTHGPAVKYSTGGYAALFEVTPEHWVASTTDGVGTKLKLAFETGMHSGVGIDLVAMCVNDLVCAGARPTTFLDYFATGVLKSEVAQIVLEGIVQGCELAGCALVGGETAEMPGMYSEGEYDLAGFAQGLLHPKHLLPRKVTPGMKVLGITSSGVHSNGFSLVRKILSELDVDQQRLRATQLMVPTRIYVKSLMPLIEESLLEAAVHVTGGGLGNLFRVLDGVGLSLTLPRDTEIPEVCAWLRSLARVEEQELYETFNMGVGMALFVSEKNVEDVTARLIAAGESVLDLGEVVSELGIVAQTPSGGELRLLP